MLPLPEGRWTETLTGRSGLTGLTGSVPLAALLADLPVALLVRE